MRLLIRRLTNRFWFTPAACVLIAVFSGIAMSNADNWIVRHTNLPFLFEGGPEGARALLSAIITSMISFTGLVFSITVVVLQLTSSQFSPRVLRGFLDDRFNQFALGVFVATFTFALVVLRSVRGTAEIDPFVPYFSVTTASVLVLVSVAVFLGYINHISQSIRAAAIISHVATDTAGMIKDLDDQSDRSEQDAV